MERDSKEFVQSRVSEHLHYQMKARQRLKVRLKCRVLAGGRGKFGRVDLAVLEVRLDVLNVRPNIASVSVFTNLGGLYSRVEGRDDVDDERRP